ncbi:MAG TPA: hypothetical protein VN844_23210 [Pyrinomonadaceae bacterium]|nr:hypothetical protein [Pyrinomonadaceae bacterium]
MTRNQKIALGCGGAGCLGLIVVAIAGGLIYYFMMSQATKYRAATRDYNFNVNLNSNSNSNDDSNSNSSSSSSTSSLSEDDRHKLFQAGAMSGDSALAQRVNVKIGLLNEDFTPAPGYQSFMAEHISWAIRDRDFIVSINTPEKAKAYVDAHLPE